MTNVLDAEKIRNAIAAGSREHIELIEVFNEIESTNSYLLAQPAPSPGRFRVALAEHQTAGRGRLASRWHSAPSSGILMSMLFTLTRKQDSLPCLTLAIGVGIARALERLGARAIRLKWPNDLIVNDAKLGGILTEIGPPQNHKTTVVTGVGLNVDLQAASRTAEIGASVGRISDLVGCMDNVPSRNALATKIIEAIFNTYAEFEANGFAEFANDWEQLDWLQGRRITIQHTDTNSTGVCQGIDTDGALLIQTSRGGQRVRSGSVSLVNGFE